MKIVKLILSAIFLIVFFSFLILLFCACVGLTVDESLIFLLAIIIFYVIISLAVLGVRVILDILSE